MPRDDDAQRQQQRQHFLEALERLEVPEHLRAGLVRYLTDRVPTGHFLRACLENNLHDAVLRAADQWTLDALPRIVRFLIDHAPGTSWGNETLVAAWLSDPSPPPLLFD